MTFKNLTNGPDSFDPASDYMLPEAFGLWYNLVGRNPQFSLRNATGIHFMAAQRNFAMGHAAMMPNAQWFESEIREFINPEVFRPVMMETPAAPGAKTDESGDVIRVNFNVSDDSIIIPAFRTRRFAPLGCKDRKCEKNFYSLWLVPIMPG